MPEYSPNLNIEKALGTENVNRAYFMRVIDDIDEKVGVPNGLAKLDANGNVLKADGTQAGEVTKTQFETHTGQAATTLKVGHVQLSDAVTSTDVTKAATSNAVKKAYDRADAAFTSASNGKTAITSAVTGADPRVVVPADPTFAQLATAVGQIKTGFKQAKGTVPSSTTIVSVRGLDFTPRKVIVTFRDLGEFHTYIMSSEQDMQGRNGGLYYGVIASHYYSNANTIINAFSNSNVVTGGFDIPGSRSGSTFTWWAFE